MNTSAAKKSTRRALDHLQEARDHIYEAAQHLDNSHSYPAIDAANAINRIISDFIGYYLDKNGMPTIAPRIKSLDEMLGYPDERAESDFTDEELDRLKSELGLGMF